VNNTDNTVLVSSKEAGGKIYELIAELFPICRSLTGNGVRRTLEILQQYIPLDVHEVPSGTQVFDWTVPKEWNIRDAYVKNAKGVRVIDFQESNLHVLNYSTPVRKTISLKELKEHLFSLSEHPAWVPYKTSYYIENWGFCLSLNNLMGLEDGEYEVVIDSSLEDGFLSYGEFFLRGEEEAEILISCHTCHPSLANDNLSGIGLATQLAKYLSTISHRYSYRFLFIPGTIGAITWLALNEESTSKIKNGLVLTGLGDGGKITYKKSRRDNAEIDRAAQLVLKQLGHDYRIVEFHPYGYDERQYCSPGFNLPVGRISRTPYGEYPEYHTSADNLDFIHPKHLQDSFEKIVEILNVLENNRIYLNLNAKCEPQLGKRGLYSSPGTDELALLWALSLSDGQHDLLGISERSGISFRSIKNAVDELFKNSLLREK
jgi:aminopeptidase-like protein